MKLTRRGLFKRVVTAPAKALVIAATAEPLLKNSVHAAPISQDAAPELGGKLLLPDPVFEGKSIEVNICSTSLVPRDENGLFIKKVEK